MKKILSILVVAIMVCSMTAFAAVPSKTTTNATVVTTIVSTTGVEIAETFSVAVAEDAEPVAKEIEKIYTFVTTNEAPVIEYFPEEVKTEIIAKLPETIAAEEVEINEFVTIEQMEYTEEYGDVQVTFSFTTVYAPEQNLVALVGLFSGEVDENGEPVVEWIVLDAVATEDGSVEITFTQDAMLKMQAAESTSLAIINTPAVEEAAE